MDEIKLRYFASVARHLNFTQAAEDLHVVQSTISKQIASLEKELGVQLFYRDHQNVRLTPAGKRLSEDVDDYMEQYRSINDSIMRLYAEFDQKLQVAMGLMEYEMLPTVIRLFNQTHPKVDISLNSYTYQRLVRHIRSGTSDVAFCNSLCAADISDAVSVPLYKEKWYVAGADDLPFWSMPRCERKRLEGQTVITLFENQFEPIRAYCKEHRMNHSGFITANRLSPLMIMLSAGLGITMIPESYISRIPSNIRIDKNLFSDPLEVETVMIYNASNKNTLIEDFARCCKTAAEEKAAEVM